MVENRVEPTPSPDAALERLVADAGQLGIALQMSQAARLLQLLDELEHWNRSYSLTAITGRPEMVSAHLLDSLAAYPELQGGRIADVGTGAGFPGLPLALVCPERHFTLIDSVGKKIRFVAHAARRLALSNVTPLHARVETLASEAPFDTVLARAFAPLPQLLDRVAPLCGPGSVVVAFLGRAPATGLGTLPPPWQVQSSRAVQVPGLAAERHLLRLTVGASAASRSTS